MVTTVWLRNLMIFGTLAMFGYLLVRVGLAVRDTGRALGEIAEGALLATASYIGKRAREERLFYDHPWKPQEAQQMLRDLRNQLKERNEIPTRPDLAFLPREAANPLLGLAVLAKVVLATAEIRQRIAFLEGRFGSQ